MSEVVDSKGASDTGPAGGQPDVQPIEPIDADGDGSGAPRAVCKCGAVAHATLPDVCAKGHGLPGNQRTRKHEPPTPPLDASPIDPSTFDALDMRKADAISLRRHMGEQDAILVRPLTRAQRRSEMKVRAALSAELQKAIQDVERMDPGHHRQQRKRDPRPLETLPRDLFDALVAWNEGRPYTIMPDRHGYVCMRCAYHGGHWGLVAPAPDVAAPIPDLAKFGEPALPALVKGNRPIVTPPQPEGIGLPYQMVDGDRKVELHEGDLADPNFPVHNDRGQFPLRYRTDRIGFARVEELL
jgi:hypothetical protein